MAVPMPEREAEVHHLQPVPLRQLIGEAVRDLDPDPVARLAALLPPLDAEVLADLDRIINGR